jgi:hypothetical protein
VVVCARSQATNARKATLARRPPLLLLADKTILYSALAYRGLAKPLGRQRELYLDVLGNRKLRYLPHRPVVGLDVEYPSVNPELPVVKRVRPLARRGFPRGNLQYLRWKRLRTFALDTRFLCDLLDLPGKPLQLVNVGARKLDSRVLRHLLWGHFLGGYLGLPQWRRIVALVAPVFLSCHHMMTCASHAITMAYADSLMPLP